MVSSLEDSDGPVVSHVVLTRFNLATPGRELAFRSKSGWLERRFDLFETYCLPSIESQEYQDFEWIVFFDQKCPDWARKRVERAQSVRHFHAKFVNLFGASGWNEAVRDTLRGPQRSEVLCTSNLDSDDAVASDYIDRLNKATRRNIGKAIPFAINFTNGLVYRDGKFYKHVHRSSAFMNVIERHDAKFKTCNVFSHMRLSKYMPVIQEEGDAAWVQVVHGTNVSNKVRGKLCRDINLKRFPFGAQSQSA